MAHIIEFNSAKIQPQTETASDIRSYSVEVSAFPGDYLEFTAHHVKTDRKSLCRIADELEKIASIIRSDVLSKMH